MTFYVRNVKIILTVVITAKMKGEITMKKIISMIMVCVLLVGMLFTLASCGLSGTYEDEYGLTTYTFKGKEFTCEGLGMEIEGTYEIKGDEITFTYEFGNAEISKTYSFERDGKTIIIDGVEYEKK